MPRYFLHIRFREGADGLALDHEGDVLPNESALREHVEATARDLMRNTRLEAVPDWRSCVIEVMDDAGRLVLTVPFSQVSTERR
ncbi:MAG TPA: hypothetical protein VEA41_14435 [Salinarimonas sp.]|nr:hypothetical protein [Salinarimonas sp.]